MAYAVTGKYRWTIKAGKRTLARGRFTVRAKTGATISPNVKFTARGRGAR